MPNTNHEPALAAALAAVERGHFLPLPQGGAVAHLPAMQPIIVLPDTVITMAQMAFPDLDGAGVTAVAKQLLDGAARSSTPLPQAAAKPARKALSISLTPDVQTAIEAERDRIAAELGVRPSLNQVVLRALRTALPPAP